MASLHIISWNRSLALLTRNIVKCSLQIIRPTPGNLFISNFCTIYFNLNAYYLYMPWYGQKSTEVTHQLFCSFYTVLQSIQPTILVCVVRACCLTFQTHWGMQLSLQPMLMQQAWCQLLYVFLRDREMFCQKHTYFHYWVIFLFGGCWPSFSPHHPAA